MNIIILIKDFFVPLFVFSEIPLGMYSKITVLRCHMKWFVIIWLSTKVIYGCVPFILHLICRNCFFILLCLFYKYLCRVHGSKIRYVRESKFSETLLILSLLFTLAVGNLSSDISSIKICKHICMCVFPNPFLCKWYCTILIALLPPLLSYLMMYLGELHSM